MYGLYTHENVDIYVRLLIIITFGPTTESISNVSKLDLVSWYKCRLLFNLPDVYARQTFKNLLFPKKIHNRW